MGAEQIGQSSKLRFDHVAFKHQITGFQVFKIRTPRKKLRKISIFRESDAAQVQDLKPGKIDTTRVIKRQNNIQQFQHHKGFAAEKQEGGQFYRTTQREVEVLDSVLRCSGNPCVHMNGIERARRTEAESCEGLVHVVHEDECVHPLSKEGTGFVVVVVMVAVVEVESRNGAP